MFFNDAIASTEFSSSLKMTNIKAVFKRRIKSFTENYRPISILPLVSKIFERIIMIIFYRNISADLEKAMVHNTVYC